MSEEIVFALQIELRQLSKDVDSWIQHWPGKGLCEVFLSTSDFHFNFFEIFFLFHSSRILQYLIDQIGKKLVFIVNPTNHT